MVVETIQSHAINAVYGAFLACTGCLRGLCHPELRHGYKKTFAWIAGSTVVLAIVGYLLTFPIHIILWIAGDTEFKAALSSILHRSLASVPFIMIATCRYVYPALFEKLFFLGIEMDNPSLRQELEQIPVNYFTWTYAVSVLFFLLHRLLLLFILGLGSVLTPIFGGLFTIIAFGYKIRRMEMIFFCSLFGFYIFPWTRSTALDLARIWFDARAIARELFEPFIARQPDLAKSKAFKSKVDQPIGISILRWPKHQAILFGFSYMLSYMMPWPFVGPFFGSMSAGILTTILVS
ncbi:hypothetical protein AeMF1_014433 [Aphanomyces euteiches]|nr:hypothetical protein AeMF1_014433 [Aphanomyces euteiches]KAH9182927.1 hypothetical protein AeNC1_015096 [Aphanomyces euteiches]